MKILTRYIFKEQLYPFLTGFLFFTFVLLLNKIFIIVDLIVNKKVEVLLVLKLFLLMLPVTISLTVPMSVLISVIMALGRLSSDFEIVALRSNGVSIYRIIKPVIISGITIFILMIIFNETLLVYSNKNYNKIYVQILKSSPEAMLEEGIFTSLGNKTIWVEKIDKKTGEMNNVMLYNKNDGGGWDVIKAVRGIWKPNNDGSKSLILFNGSLYSSEFDRKSFSIIDFNDSNAEVMLSESKIAYTDEAGKFNPSEVDSIELYNKLNSISDSHEENRDVALYWVEFYKKHAIPFSCFVFAIIGIPIGLFTKRSSKGIGFGISIIVFFIYYIIFMIGQYFAIKGIIHPLIGVWIANIILLIASIILLLLKDKFVF